MRSLGYYFGRAPHGCVPQRRASHECVAHKRASRKRAPHNLIGVHLTGVHFMGVYLAGVHLMGVHLMGVYLTSVHLMGVPHGRVSHGRAPHLQVFLARRTWVARILVSTSRMVQKLLIAGATRPSGCWSPLERAPRGGKLPKRLLNGQGAAEIKAAALRYQTGRNKADERWYPSRPCSVLNSGL